MSTKILVLGGYGNFGKRISSALAKKGLSVIVAGRSLEKATAFSNDFPPGIVEAAAFDVTRDLARQLQRLKPSVVINTCGPFQTSDYSVAQACLDNRVHYIDLADGRDFVNGISALNNAAEKQGVTLVSGASTVPGLSSAVIERYRADFSRIESLRYGISPGQRAERGLATTQAIMTYVGKPLKPFTGSREIRYGWQDVYRQTFPVLGPRWMSNCDVPDLDLLPSHYGIDDIRFSAGLELSVMHLGLWGLSWLMRLGVPLNLPKQAALLLRISDWFDIFGSADGGMHMILRGKDTMGNPRERRWFIIAKDGDGPQIPTVPAIVLAEKLALGSFQKRGALACVGLVSLEEYLDALCDFNIQIHTNEV